MCVRGSVRAATAASLTSLLCGRRCVAALQVIDYSTSKTGKHGHAKAKIVATDIFNGRKYEDVQPTSHNMFAPNGACVLSHRVPRVVLAAKSSRGDRRPVTPLADALVVLTAMRWSALRSLWSSSSCVQ